MLFVYLKLMSRMIPNDLLFTIEYWFSSCSKWGNSFSNFIALKCGVRQGGVLSPYLFSVCIDDIVRIVQKSNFGCHFGVCIILYADDILLLAPSVYGLQVICSGGISYIN